MNCTQLKDRFQVRVWVLGDTHSKYIIYVIYVYILFIVARYLQYKCYHFHIFDVPFSSVVTQPLPHLPPELLHHLRHKLYICYRSVCLCKDTHVHALQTHEVYKSVCTHAGVHGHTCMCIYLSIHSIIFLQHAAIINEHFFTQRHHLRVPRISANRNGSKVNAKRPFVNAFSVSWHQGRCENTEKGTYKCLSGPLLKTAWLCS